MISRSHRFVFVHIPRTGGTSVETALAPYASDPIGFTTGGCTVLPHKHATAATLRQLLGPAWPRFFRFSVVRNPWERMLSDYCFFRDTGPQLYPEFSPLERELTTGALELEFNTWLEVYADRLEICQLDYLRDDDGTLLVDEICRFEALERDFTRIAAILGVAPNLPRTNSSRRPPVADAYSPQGIDVVRRYCTADLERFGYRFG